MLTDVDGSRVLEAVPERTQTAAQAARRTLLVEQRQQAKAAAADMATAYATAAANQTPYAQLLNIKGRVAKHLGEAVDQVRRVEKKGTEADNRRKAAR